MSWKTYICILITLISCTNKNGEMTEIKNNCFQILNIEKNKNPKVFFSLDPECPLCKSYSKTINKLYEKYNNDFEFYGFFPSIVFLIHQTYSSSVSPFHA